MNHPRRTLFFFLQLLLVIPAVAQLDSLDRILRDAKADSTRLRLCNEFSATVVNADVKNGIYYASQALTVARKINDRSGEATALVNLGYALYYSGNGDSALVLYRNAIVVAREAGDSLNVSRALNRIAFVNREKGNQAEAMRYYNLSLQSNKGETFVAEAANSYLNIGVLYQDENKLDDALKYELKGLQLYQDAHDEPRVANAMARLGNLYLSRKDTATALDYYNRSMSLFEKNNHLRGVAICLNNIAMIYDARNDYPKALNDYQRALEIRKKIGDKNGTALVGNNIGGVYLSLGEFGKAKEYLFNSLAISKELDYREMMQSDYLGLSHVYEKTGDADSALYFFKLYHAIYDSINNEAGRKQLNELNAKFEKDASDKQIAALEREGELQQTRNWIMGGGIGVLCVLMLVIWRNAQQSKKANQVLEAQKAEIAMQKRIVEDQHRDMVDSINYAQRIQQAILPSEEERKNLFPESFVFFRPRDIVSGDFWWMSQAGGVRLFAAADCTGHGVPGAFMSMIGNTLLNEIVNEKKVTDPGLILNQLSAAIVQALRQKENTGDELADFSPINMVKDGMDISLCVFDDTAGLMFFAGANNSALYRSGNELIELKGDRQPIGFYAADKKPFNVRVVPLKEVDAVYLFSDGYADQFGGPAAKKFKISRLKELLLQIKDLSPEEQNRVLEKTFEDWRGPLGQVDDILVAGIFLK